MMSKKPKCKVTKYQAGMWALKKHISSDIAFRYTHSMKEIDTKKLFLDSQIYYRIAKELLGEKEVEKAFNDFGNNKLEDVEQWNIKPYMKVVCEDCGKTV